MASLPVCVYVSTGARWSGAETAACPPPRFTLRLHLPLEKRWKSSFPLHSFFEMTCSSLWPANQQETSAAQKKHINSCTLRLRVNRLPDTGDSLCLRGVWLLLHVAVRSSMLRPQPCHDTQPNLCRASARRPLFPPVTPYCPPTHSRPFSGLPFAKPKRKMQRRTTAVVLDCAWQMGLSLFLLISNIMTFPFKNADVAGRVTRPWLWVENKVGHCWLVPLYICSASEGWGNWVSEGVQKIWRSRSSDTLKKQTLVRHHCIHGRESIG